MTQPTAYVPVTNFQQEETSAVAGRSTVRTSAVDAELQSVSLTLSQILTNLAIIQRDDTQLNDLVVTTASLSANVKALFAGGINPRGAWLTATAYAVKDVVETLSPLISYVCVIAHTSGTFATDRTAGKWMVLGSEPGVGTLTSLTLTTGGITLGTNNTQDLAATANRFRSGYFGTSVFATTSVGTPLVASTGTALNFSVTGLASQWVIDNFPSLYPSADTGSDIGKAANRVRQIFTPIIDSGTAGSLSLKTNNGTLGLRLDNAASAVNFWQFSPNSTGNRIFSTAQGSDSNIGILWATAGTGGHDFFTGGSNSSPSASSIAQFQVLHTASANRNITVTGSNGGNPTIGVTAGSLAITPAVVMAGALSVSGVTLFGTTIANTGNAAGLTINQGGVGDEILSLKSSTVAHGMTGTTETDTFGLLSKQSASAGGVNISGFSESTIGLSLNGDITTEDTTKATNAVAAIRIFGGTKSGTAVAAMGANSNILAVGSTVNTRFILDADGDSHQDVGTAWTNFDEHDDVALLEAIAATVARPGDPLREAFIAELESRRSQIEALPGKAIVTFNDDGHHFINMSRLVMLQHGAIRQLAGRLSTVERKLLQ